MFNLDFNYVIVRTTEPLTIWRDDVARDVAEKVCGQERCSPYLLQNLLEEEQKQLEHFFEVKFSIDGKRCVKNMS